MEETPGASGYAGYKDWFIEEYDRPGYTVEAGMGENPLPMTQFERIYHDNKGILVGGMTQLTLKSKEKGRQNKKESWFTGFSACFIVKFFTAGTNSKNYSL